MEIPSQLLTRSYIKVDIEMHILRYQLYGNNQRLIKRKMDYEQDTLNKQQTFLYLRALNGLSVYKPEELAKMGEGMKSWISKTQQRTHRTLNLWKQQIINELTNVIFDLHFPQNSKLKKTIDNDRDFVDLPKQNTLSFKDLGIKKSDIIQKLIEVDILPKNFYELKSNN